MKIAVLGTGMVGKTLAGKVASLGHEVSMGTRDVAATMARTEKDGAGNPPVAEWLKANPGVTLATFADAAKDAELVINAGSGQACLAMLEAAKEHLGGKILIDVSNPLDFSNGFPPTLTIVNDDSLGEQIQKAYPETKVVKTLNTVNATLMVAPEKLAGGDHTMFVCGNDEDARGAVAGYLKEWFGWKDVIDMGDIESARGTEMLLPIWTRLYGKLQTPSFAFKIVR